MYFSYRFSIIFKGMLKIGIIGAGPAGSAIAIFLTRAGHDVSVFEKVHEPGPVGAGLMLQRTGLKVLQELGVGNEIESLGEQIRYFRGFNAKGKRVLSLNLSIEDEDDNYGVGIQRGALFNALFSQVQNSETKIYTGRDIVDINGEKRNKILTDSTGVEYGAFDLIIVANGARSVLRKNLKITRADQPQEWGAVWTLLRTDESRYDNSIIHNYKGTSKMLGFMSVGKLAFNEERKINFFWSLKMSEKKLWQELSSDDWKAQILSMAPEHENILNGLDKENCIIAPYHDAFVSPMYDNGVFFIGDSAHAMSPQLSAGTNLSLLDSWLLATCLSKQGDIEEQAGDFYKLRKAQLRYYYRISKLVTPMFQSDYKLAWVRNQILGGLLKISGPKQIFRDTLLGRKKSLFSKIDRDWYV